MIPITNPKFFKTKGNAKTPAPKTVLMILITEISIDDFFSLSINEDSNIEGDLETSEFWFYDMILFMVIYYQNSLYSI